MFDSNRRKTQKMRKVIIHLKCEVKNLDVVKILWHQNRRRMNPNILSESAGVWSSFRVLTGSRWSPAHPPPHQTASDWTLFPVWALNQRNRYSSCQRDSPPPDQTTSDQDPKTRRLIAHPLSGRRRQRGLWLVDKCDLWGHRSWCEHWNSGGLGGPVGRWTDEGPCFGWRYLPASWVWFCLHGGPGWLWTCWLTGLHEPPPLETLRTYLEVSPGFQISHPERRSLWWMRGLLVGSGLELDVGQIRWCTLHLWAGPDSVPTLQRKPQRRQLPISPDVLWSLNSWWSFWQHWMKSWPAGSGPGFGLDHLGQSCWDELGQTSAQILLLLDAEQRKILQSQNQWRSSWWFWMRGEPVGSGLQFDID